MNTSPATKNRSIAVLLLVLCIACRTNESSTNKEGVREGSRSQDDVSYNAFVKEVADSASLELAGINFRLGTKTDSALSLLPTGIEARFYPDNNAYGIMSSGTSLGNLYIRNGRVYAVRKFISSGKTTDIFKLFKEIERRGGGKCTASATEFSPDDLPSGVTALYDFISECGPVYKFTLRTSNRRDSWTAYAELQLPENSASSVAR